MGNPAESIVLAPGEGTEYHPSFLGAYRTVFKADTHTTSGHYTLSDDTVPAGRPIARHIHLTREESFYVLSGVLDFHVGERIGHASAGSFLQVPRGTAHGFSNPGDQPARMLAIWSPGGFEDCFADWVAAFPEGTPVDMATIIAIWKKHDTVPVP